MPRKGNKFMYCVNCWYREHGDGSVCKNCKEGNNWMYYETKQRRGIRGAKYPLPKD